MWPDTFDQRLASWHQLRSRVTKLDLADALLTINQWWWAAPWCAMSLNWQDQDDWPDPWELLSSHKFCYLARALGMSYTVIMLPQIDLQDCNLMELAGRDVVSISGTRYILNWSPDTIVDMTVMSHDPDRCISLNQLKSKIN